MESKVKVSREALNKSIKEIYLSGGFKGSVAELVREWLIRQGKLKHG